MEEEIIREQPEIEEQVQSDCECGTSMSSQEGSLGKFKDIESLLNAYNSLQAEFTRKCQKLKELEVQEIEEKEVYSNPDWNEKVSVFLEKHPEAKKYASEISEYILRTPELKSKPEALAIAWSEVATKKFVEPEKLVGDKTFLNSYIFSNDEIKKQVLELYLNELKSAPIVIGSSGQSPASKKQENPTTMGEANKILKQMFKF